MWKTVKLKDVCSVFTDGDWIETKDQSAEGIRLVQTGNVKTGSFADRKDKARYISNETFARLNCTEVMEGDILVSRLPEPVGRACVIPKLQEKAITAVDCTLIRTKEEVLPTYLNYYMQSPQYFSLVQEKVTGATRQRISRKNLGEVLVSIPPLAEQQRIVAKLDAAFAEIDRAIDHTKEKQKAIEDLTSTTKKNFLEAEMSGAMTLLGESCEFFNGKAHEKDIDDQGKYVVVNSKFISSEGTVKKYTNEQMFPLSHGDIVMVMSDVPKGKALAKTYLIEEGDKYSLNQRICCIRSTNYDAKYLKTIIDRNPHFLKRDNGENQTNLRKADILSCPLPVTTAETQEEREKFLSSLTADLKSILLVKQRIIDEYIKLKSAILSQELQPPQSEAA